MGHPALEGIGPIPESTLTILPHGLPSGPQNRYVSDVHWGLQAAAQPPFSGVCFIPVADWTLFCTNGKPLIMCGLGL
jgi:hypothetical protein